MDFRLKRKVLDTIVSGNGVIPYDKMVSIDSLNIKPKNGIFITKDEFYSTLNRKAVNEEKYNNSKLLNTLLKMPDNFDLNDLHNVQDVIFLCEIMENRFQTIIEKLGCNPRNCNSACKLSGCI